MNTLNVSIVTPNGEVYSGDNISMIVVNTTSGQLGIMANHVPMVASLKIGELKIVKSDKEEKLVAVSEGFVETHKNNVTVMVQTAECSEDIDVVRAEKSKNRAEERLADESNSNIDIRRAQISLNKALTRLKVAGK